MTADAAIAGWARPARRRSLGWIALAGLPLVAALALVGWRLAGTIGADAAGVAAVLALLLVAWRSARRFDRRWLLRRLDSRPEMEDSADLLLVDDAPLPALARLQRARLRARLAEAPPDLRPAWRWPPLLAAWGLALALGGSALFWPAPAPRIAKTRIAAAAPAGPPRLLSASLAIGPPAYTGLPARRITGLDARAVVGSRLGWTIELAPQPAAAALVTSDGRRLPLVRSGDVWRLDRGLGTSLLYRVVAPELATQPLHRIDAVPDAPPQVRVLAPETSLTLLRFGQRRWPLAFVASDDFGVAASARLRITITSGEGENIRSKESELRLIGNGPATARRFAASLDPVALGLTVGNDLVAQLIVADNRRPGPQETRSASVILRWPPDLGQESRGLDGMVKTVLPAYFRSQRQIIIEAEALVKARPRLAADRFDERADTIGVDQRVLRLRYGQFLGEDSGGGAELPTSDAPPLPTSDAPPAPAPAPHDDHVQPRKPASFGSATDVLAEYGHTHDESEAATLFDPETREQLRQALDAMWQSEGELRQGRPAAALPHAYRALRFIKAVQQATRLFLARTGPQLPSIDLDRRLQADRSGLAAPSLALVAGDRRDAVAATVWAALAAPGGAAVPLGPLSEWLAGNRGRLADPLALAAAIDALRQDAGCVACRDRLRAALWAALDRPPAGVARRSGADAAGRRYLEALP
jgi:hypothetical protein